jgi:hypothetical protein
MEEMKKENFLIIGSKEEDLKIAKNIFEASMVKNINKIYKEGDLYYEELKEYFKGHRVQIRRIILHIYFGIITDLYLIEEFKTNEKLYKKKLTDLFNLYKNMYFDLEI